MSKTIKNLEKSIKLQQRTLANLEESRTHFEKYPAHLVDLDSAIETTKMIITILENKISACERNAI